MHIINKNFKWKNQIVFIENINKLKIVMNVLS